MCTQARWTSIPSRPRDAQGLAFDNGSVWVGSASSYRITRLDASSLRLQERLELPVHAATLVAVGAASLWVSSGPLIAGGGVTRVRLPDGNREKLVKASNPVEVTFGNGAAWFADIGTLNRIGASTNDVKSIDLGSAPADPSLGFDRFGS